jgi:hypothetical protein
MSTSAQALSLKD